MVLNNVCLVSFEMGNFKQQFEIEKGAFNIGFELIKFICYIEDYSMMEYFKRLIKNSRFEFNESFFISELKNKTLVKEIVLDKNNTRNNYNWSYIIDLDCEYLCYINYKNGFINYQAFPFEQISEYPYSCYDLI